MDTSEAWCRALPCPAVSTGLELPGANDQSPRPANQAGRSPWIVLALAVVGISFAAPLVRLSSAAPLVVAAWRLGFSVAIVALALLASGAWREWRTLSRPTLMLTIAAGALLTVHFWSWNASLRYTTVAASVTLVNIQPVIVALVSARWLGERASRKQWIGIAVAVFGATIVGLSDVPGGVSGIVASLTGSAASSDGNSGGRLRALFGDALALVGAITAAGYYLIGRQVRKTLTLWPYVGLVYGVAFLGCVILAVVTGGALLPQPPRELAIFAGLALGPMLLGHTGMNWALGHLPAYVVNLTVLGEPIGATILAAVLPGIHEVPGPGTIIGAVLVLGGVLLAARRP